MEKLLKENALSSGIRIISTDLIAIFIDQEVLWEQKPLDLATFIYQPGKWREKLVQLMLDNAMMNGWLPPNGEDIELAICVPAENKMLITIRKMK